jgi:muramoyltetrapeptide carboxypeptidase
VALASPIRPSLAGRAMALLRAAGYDLVIPHNLFASERYLAGSDATRVEALCEVLDGDPAVLLATRGGYGSMRLLPHLPWERLAAWGGWLVGFSDLTAVHAACATRFPFATLHGPNLSGLLADRLALPRLERWLGGRAARTLFRFGASKVVRPGVASGVSAGGTLAILAALAGTAYEPDYDGAVLFLEDVSEPTYRLDRLLTQLHLSSRLAAVKAVVAGRLERCGERRSGWRRRWRELLAEVAPEAVVIEGLPFGHGARNVPLPLGVEVEVDTVRGTVSWEGGGW